ncbi:MAG: hypothetical protein IKN71_04065, partial [Alphaproteobacteria bacterium]|nr:hypothetical protein [Alphaproteobacteria bacterium]
MLKLTRTGIGLLTRQYRSVLHKCFLINFGLFALGAAFVPLESRAEVAPLTSTLDTIRAESITYLQGTHGQYTLSTNKGSNTNSVMIGGTTYYYTPGSSDTAIVNLANTGGAALTKITNYQSGDDYVFTDGTNYYTYDISGVSTSTDKLAKSGIKINDVTTSNQYVLATEQGTLTNSVTLGGNTYYYTPESGDTAISSLAANNGALLTTTGATADNYVFKIDGETPTYYTYDKTKLVAQTQADGTSQKYYDITHETPAGYTEGGTAVPGVDALKYYTGKSISASKKGGAITVTSNIASITADFSNNRNDGGYPAPGAVFHSDGTIGSLSADFYQNTAKTDGGALRNNKGTINYITGDFVGNNVYDGDGGALSLRVDGGSSIINNIYGNFINNSVTGADRNGGALQFYNSSTIQSIIANFTGNTATLHGGAINNGINNNSSRVPVTINKISGSFTDNTATSGNGGAIDNFGDINGIEAVFVNNTAGNFGGAIYTGDTKNPGSLGATSGVKADFIANRAISGGAIYNGAGTIYNIEGELRENKALDGSGGAIYNKGTISGISANVTGNEASSSGGAIYNEGTISGISANATGNRAISGLGGAIYNEGTITIATNASHASILFSNNTDSTGYNDIYTKGGTINLNATVGATDETAGTIIFNGTIAGTNAGDVVGQYILNATGGNYVFNNLVNANTINLTDVDSFKLGTITQADSSVTTGNLAESAKMTISGTKTKLDTQNGDINTVNIDTLTLDSVVAMAVDAKLNEGIMDTFHAATISGTGSFIIDAINVLAGSDTSSDRVELTLTTDASQYDKYAVGKNLLNNITGTSNVFGNATYKNGTLTLTTLSLEGLNKQVGVWGNGNYIVAYDNTDDAASAETSVGANLEILDTAIKQVSDSVETSVMNMTREQVPGVKAIKIDKAGIDSKTYLENNPDKHYTLVTTHVEGDIEIKIAEKVGNTTVNNTYYFTPSGDAGDVSIANLVVDGYATLKEVSAEDVAGGAGYVFTNGSKYWTLDTTKHSGTKIVESNSNDYNYSEVLSDGRTKYYKVIHEVPEGYTMATERITDLDHSIDEMAFWNLEGHGTSSGGGAITIKDGKVIDHITADFKGNSTDGETGVAGAVYVSENSKLNNLTGSFEANIGSYGGVVQTKGYIGHILGDFVNNEDMAGGAAIDNNGIIDSIVGDFLGNFDKTPADATEKNMEYNGGGAIRNTKRNGSLPAYIKSIKGQFINNYAMGKYGGAINNQGTIDAIDAYFTGNSAYNSGGAIYNMGFHSDALIGEISGDFLENISGNAGGAIYNSGKEVGNLFSTINKIYNATFTGNTSESSGGAIYNGERGQIKKISADFVENHAKNGDGGAIAYYGSGIANFNNDVEEISGSFVENTAGLYGGAIYLNKANVAKASFNFAQNKAKYGGAVALSNGAIVTDFNADFIENEATQGGALYVDNSTISALTGDFTSNKATDLGGAIYNVGKVNLTADDKNIAFYNNTDKTGYNDIYNDAGRINMNAAEGKQISFGGSIIGKLTFPEGYTGLASEDIDRQHNTIGINTDEGATGGTYIFNNVIEGNNVEWHNSAHIKFGSQVQEDGTTTYGYVNNVGMVEITQAPYLFRAYDEEGGYYNHWTFDTTNNPAAADYLKYYDKIDYVMTDITNKNTDISISGTDYKFKSELSSSEVSDLIANATLAEGSTGSYVFKYGNSSWTIGSAANDKEIDKYLKTISSTYTLGTSGTSGAKSVTINGTTYYYTLDTTNADPIANLIAGGALVEEVSKSDVESGKVKAVFKNSTGTKYWTISALGSQQYNLTKITGTQSFKIDDTSFVYTPETDEQISSIASAATLTEVGEDEKWVFRYTDSNNNTKYWKLDADSAAQYTKNLRYTLSKDAIEGASSVVIGDTTYYYKPGDTAIVALTGNDDTSYSFVQTAILDTVNNHLEDNKMQQLFLEGDVKLRMDIDLGNSYRHNADGLDLGNGSDTFTTGTRKNTFGQGDTTMIIDSINLLGASRKNAVAVQITNEFNRHVAVSPNILENIEGADNLHGKVEYRDETGELVVHDRFTVMSDLAEMLNTLVGGTVATYHGLYEVDANGDVVYLKNTDTGAKKYLDDDGNLLPTYAALGFSIEDGTGYIIDGTDEKIKKFDPLVGTITYSSNDESVTEADNSPHGIFYQSKSPTDPDYDPDYYDNDYKFVKGRAVRLLDETLVHKTGNETIKGIKTFESETVGSGDDAKKYTTALNGTTLTMSEVAGTETPTVTNKITLDGSDGSASFAGLASFNGGAFVANGQALNVGDNTAESADATFNINGTQPVKSIVNAVDYSLTSAQRSEQLVTAEAVATAYTAGTGISITNGVISNTQTSAEWGNIEGNIEDQEDLQKAFAAIRTEATNAYNHAHNWAEYVLGVDVDENRETQLQTALNKLGKPVAEGGDGKGNRITSDNIVGALHELDVTSAAKTVTLSDYSDARGLNIDDGIAAVFDGTNTATMYTKDVVDAVYAASEDWLKGVTGLNTAHSKANALHKALTNEDTTHTNYLDTASSFVDAFKTLDTEVAKRTVTLNNVSGTTTPDGTATVSDGATDATFYTKDMVDAVFADKQNWANKEFGYDTSETDAPMVLEAAGFEKEGGKLGFSQAIIQNKRAIEAGSKYFAANSTEDAASATGEDAIAVGPASTSTALESLAIGSGADATAQRTVAIGANADATNDFGIAIGGLAKAKAEGGVALGTSANVAESATNSMALGNSSKAEGAISVALGQEANTKGLSSISIGTSSKAEAATSVALGHQADAIGESGIAIGTVSKAKTTAVALGHNANADGESALAMGTNAVAGKTAIALGHGASASAESAIAIGTGASATATAVALGHGSTATEANTVSVGNASLKRKIVNVAAGTADNDAVNVSQLNEKYSWSNIKGATNGDEADEVITANTKVYSVAGTNEAITSNILMANPSDTQFLKTVRNNLGTYGEKAVSAGAMMQFAGEIGYNMKQDQLGWDINVDTSNADSFSEKLTSSLYDGLTKKTTARTVVGALNVAGEAIKDRKVTLGTGDNLGTASITDGTNTAVVYTKDKTDTLLTDKANVSLNNITDAGRTVIDNRVIANAAYGTFDAETDYTNGTIGAAIKSKVDTSSVVDYVNATAPTSGQIYSATSIYGSLRKADSAIQGVQVNGTDLSPDSNKKVNVTIATGTNSGSLAVNGTDVVISAIKDANVAGDAAISLNKLATVDASKALVSDANGHIAASSVTATELGYLSGVTSSVQDQLDSKYNYNAIVNASTGEGNPTADTAVYSKLATDEAISNAAATKANVSLNNLNAAGNTYIDNRADARIVAATASAFTPASLPGTTADEKIAAWMGDPTDTSSNNYKFANVATTFGVLNYKLADVENDLLYGATTNQHSIAYSLAQEKIPGTETANPLRTQVISMITDNAAYGTFDAETDYTNGTIGAAIKSKQNTLTPGDGISIASDTITVDYGQGLDMVGNTAGSRKLAVKLNGNTLDLSDSGLKIANGGVGTTQLADDAVTTDKILNENVTKAKLAQTVQDSLDLADSAIQGVQVNGTDLTPDSNNKVNVTVTTGTASGSLAVNGTDVAVKNVVTTDTQQTIGGAKTFSSVITANGGLAIKEGEKLTMNGAELTTVLKDDASLTDSDNAIATSKVIKNAIAGSTGDMATKTWVKSDEGAQTANFKALGDNNYLTNGTLQSALNALGTKVGDSVLTTTATTLTGAINELDSEKFDKTGGTISGNTVVDGTFSTTGKATLNTLQIGTETGAPVIEGVDTVIDENSTDTKIVTAKAVYDAVKDLPLDENVVHKTGHKDEDINGKKTFEDLLTANGGLAVSGVADFYDNVNIGTAEANKNLTINGRLSASDLATLANLSVTNGASIGGSFDVSGLATLSGTNGMRFGSGQIVTSIVNVIDPDAADEVLQTQLVTAKAVRQYVNDVDAATREELGGLIDAEEAARQQADAQLDRRITNEVQARQSADSQLNTDIAMERMARQAADVRIETEIVAEQNARQVADSQLRNEFMAADQNLSEAIRNERQARKDADTALSERINTETAERKAADIALGERIDANAQAIADEAQTRAEDDEVLGGRIDAEISNRENADALLGGRIDAETTNRENADALLGGRIDAETTNRENADALLGGRIDDETTNRENADALLGGRIDEAVQSVATEAQAREDADNVLNGRISDEITNRENADALLGGRIDAETTNRENADALLGGRIDAETTNRENADA